LVHEVLKHGARLNRNNRSVCGDLGAREFENDAAIAGVGDDQVAAAADDSEWQSAGAGDIKCRDECIGALRFGKEVGRAADGEARMEGERNLRENL
jgi:hypothetical protein